LPWVVDTTGVLVLDVELVAVGLGVAVADVDVDDELDPFASAVALAPKLNA
jgi:hypothetical protein